MDQPRVPIWKRTWLYIVGLIGVFVAAFISGAAGRLVDRIFALPESPGQAVQSSPAHTLNPTSTEQASVGRTRELFVRPWDGEGNLLPKYVVTDRSKAKCITTVVASDPDALRCFTETSLVLDPCWTKSGGVAVCLDDPWSTSVFMVEIKAVEQNPSHANDSPWALELQNDVRCLFMGGTGDIVAGMRVNYQCMKGGQYVGDVVGQPNRDTQPWQVFFNPHGQSEVRQENVLSIWR